MSEQTIQVIWRDGKIIRRIFVIIDDLPKAIVVEEIEKGRVVYATYQDLSITRHHNLEDIL